ncbi:trypsin alpha-3-like [Sabethes cyaneus]|uniref:trypsin alpha-3-like n=1 Tax=Sabethes cyaneus TaxID=53552 RepID=UPI00237EE652|nr:trypsin alpha-3-like [Sabethes cyaneus]
MKLLVISLLCVIANADNSARLSGGVTTFTGQYPAVVSIDSPYILHCGGTIVDLQHVLTAASCVMHPTTFSLVNPHWLRVIAGDLNLVPASYHREVRNVSRLFVHPNYNNETNNNDLAVLRLSRPFPEFHNTIEPAILATRAFTYGTQCRYVGWGTTTSGPTAAINPTQRSINVPIIAAVECNVPTVHNFRVLPAMICAGSLTATPDTTCQGNVGGGLYCNEQLAGVLIFGLACGSANQPGVYTDVRQYRQWIYSQFDRTDNPQPGWLPQPL